MNYKPYPQEYWTLIQSKIDHLKNEKKDLIAAFDADGTLWDADLGENFFQYQIDNKCVPLPANTFEHYLELKKINNDPRDAFLWLAQINKNQSIEQVRIWAKNAFVQIQPNPIFNDHVKVFIVTASIKWSVEPGAIALGIPVENIVGVETYVENNIITDRAIQPVTYKEGKVTALLAKTNGQLPFLASGNTMGDFELLTAATNIRLAVSAASHDDSNYRTEMELIRHADKNNWLNHRFI
jgi:hypothetical protein